MSDEPTRMMTSPAGPEKTLLATPQADPLRTQLGGTTVCPVCHTTTPVLESYCCECGFLLSATVPESLEMAPEEAPPAELVELETGRRHRLRVGENTVGRQGTDVLLLDSTVSRSHARIRVENGQVFVEDLGSTNGTKVGDVRLSPNQPVVATGGTLLRFGNVQLRLEVRGGEGQGVGLEGAEKTVAIAASSEATLLAPAMQPVETAPPVAWLRKLEGPGNELPVPAGVSRIGRRPANELVVTGDAYVSGSHAEIRVENEEAWLTDIGSTNGTFVNGRRLMPNQPQRLEPGDEVKIGQTSYRFEWVEQPQSQEAPQGMPEPQEEHPNEGADNISEE